ncbi:nucleotidyltransferase domain-containing protein [Prevotella corporis]|nr:nucleotidyltransferase domain-containing protein [Prevotella corporis]
MNYQQKIRTLSSRYNPEASVLIEQRQFSDVYSSDDDVVKYVKSAMAAVDADYTNKTKEAGTCVKQHLKGTLQHVSYEYQGSVMTDTHIKGASDIDLLVLSEKFYGTEIDKVRVELQNQAKYSQYQINRLQNYNNAFSLYQGDSTQDLAQLRSDIEEIMTATYSLCDIDNSKAVKITNQHLHRDVDIVTSSWFQSLDYVLEGMPQERRGINIYNKEKGYAEGPDYPFLSISRINSRSAKTQGRLKRMIRFLKNVRTDSDYDIPLNSFEINAICYSIPIQDYYNLNFKDLVYIVWYNMYHLWKDNKENQLRSVVGDEYVFLGKPNKVQALKVLEDEVYQIYNDLKNI